MHPKVLENDYQIIEAAGLLHDIGMIGLPNETFSKKRTEMNSDEKQQFLSHPVRGEIMLYEIEFMRPISKLIRSHHEQFNGKGFPDGLSGDNLPLEAQIISAASIYDNLVHRGEMPLADIPGKLCQLRNYLLDPSIVDCLLDINVKNIEEENKKQFKEVSIDNLKKGMILAQDVRMKTGAIILPESTTLTDHSIQKLSSYKSLNQFDQKVFIYKGLG
jgi:HD-GYP domain-containing protein (c-di-GMP phosphodiesterase class II)